jgi:hypothetical protein
MNSVLMQSSAALDQTCNTTIYENKTFLDPFAKIAKTDCYLRHVILSVRPAVRLPFRMKQLGFPWTDFHEIFIFKYFSKICQENRSFITT